MEQELHDLLYEAGNHPYFKEQDVNNYWQIRAEKYAASYDGSFDFMVKMKFKVESQEKLSPKMVSAILNCARKEGSKLVVDDLPDFNTSQEEKEVLEKLEEGLTENPVQPVGEVVVSSLHFKSLSEIEAQMRILEEGMAKIKESVAPLQKVYDENVSEEKQILEEVERKITNLRVQRKEVHDSMLNAERELAQIQMELENQRRLHNLTIQQIAAEQKFNKLKGQFDELRKQMPWHETIAEYQWDDVCFQLAAFKSGKNGILNANPMGAGKTFETGAFDSVATQLFFEMYGRQPRCIWFTKKSLRHSSFRELRRWNPERLIIVLDGNSTARDFQVDVAVGNNAMVIANYDMMNTTPKLLEYDWDFVYMDEVHKLKGGANSTPTKIFENAKIICEKAKFIVPMSGSPIQNHPKEMWTYLHLLDPDHFPNVRRFEREFCFGYGEKDADGNPIQTVNWERIIKVLTDRVIRRDKHEIDPQLPDKVREFRYVEMAPEQRKIYDKLKTEFFVWLDEQKSQSMTATAIIAQLTRLRQINLVPSSVKIVDPETKIATVLDCHESGKLDEAMDILEELLNENEQVVVFSSQFNEPLFELERRIRSQFNVPTETLTGENSSDVDGVEQRFQNGETKVLLINMKTGSEGLNLQKFPERWPGGASHAIFLDLWWNPESNKQGEDRIWRKGQTETANIHIIQGENSVDSFIASILEEKEAMIEGITNRDEYKKNASDWKQMLLEMI